MKIFFATTQVGFPEPSFNSMLSDFPLVDWISGRPSLLPFGLTLLCLRCRGILRPAVEQRLAEIYRKVGATVAIVLPDASPAFWTDSFCKYVVNFLQVAS
jgi:hypothetical protein